MNPPKVIIHTFRGRALKRTLGMRVDPEFIEDLMEVPEDLRLGALQMLDDPHIRRHVRRLLEKEMARRG